MLLGAFGCVLEVCVKSSGGGQSALARASRQLRARSSLCVSECALELRARSFFLCVQKGGHFGGSPGHVLGVGCMGVGKTLHIQCCWGHLAVLR